jgi:glycosyltransferase involved in cell wall biosynthesis
MKIAIVAPSPVPFVIGGAENLWWGLLNEINQHTPHQAELIKLPSPERNFAELIASYRHFSQLDLDHFDLVISTKYPAWMVRHDRHICYMQHRLRGLYDTYHLMSLPDGYSAQHPGVLACQQMMRHPDARRAMLPEFFDQLATLLADPSVPAEILDFPGPFIREVIHFLDGIALTPNAIRRFSAISGTVAGRQNYFPATAQVQIVNHPSNLSGFHCAGDDYLFTASRLDGAKRLKLLIEAMHLVKADIRLKIAGSGPDEELLKQLASDDPRIEFLGFVNDCALVDLYADALAVPYLPYQEDYGLVTIEAMMSGKPVLTVTDAGGPTEIVVDGTTGFIVPPSAAALAEKIDYLHEHRQECRRMGQEGLKRAQPISWQKTVLALLDTDDVARINATDI